MKKRLLVLIAGALVLILSACSNKPDDVSEEFWYNSIQTILYINNATENKEMISTDVTDSLGTDPSLQSETEREISPELIELAICSLKYMMALELGNTGEEELEDYKDKFKDLEEIFGKSNLKASKFNESKVLTLAETAIEEKTQRKEDETFTFMNQNNVTLTGNEIQYDLENNLDEKFYLEGTVELCDYFNYNFKNEKDYFCARLTPFDGGISDSWYIYMNRNDFESVYGLLLENPFQLRVIANIPSHLYERGQGNMAVVTQTSAY